MKWTFRKYEVSLYRGESVLSGRLEPYFVSVKDGTHGECGVSSADEILCVDRARETRDEAAAREPQGKTAGRFEGAGSFAGMQNVK
jgi:hypothetical protein